MLLLVIVAIAAALVVVVDVTVAVASFVVFNCVAVVSNVAVVFIDTFLNYGCSP